MGQRSKVFDVLLKLGEVTRTQGDWLDYEQYGVGRDDVDDLIDLVADDSLHTALSESDEVWVPLHAWRALGQLADPRAIAPLIGVFDLLCEDDWALAELPIVLAMLGPNAIRPLAEFLTDRSRAEFARVMAVSALEAIAERQPLFRDQVVSIITDYLDNEDPSALGLNGSVVNSLLTLNATESIDVLRRLYERGTVDLFACGDIEEVEMELGLRSERSTPAPNLLDLYGTAGARQTKREKIGRNDPCPCGSGKKYKKCCLQ
jgi:hypothetical protein